MRPRWILDRHAEIPDLAAALDVLPLVPGYENLNQEGKAVLELLVKNLYDQGERTTINKLHGYPVLALPMYQKNREHP